MITRVFKSGNSQAVRIPKEYLMPEGEVEICKRGDELIIRPLKQQKASVLMDAIGGEGESDIVRPEFLAQERDFGSG